MVFFSETNFTLSVGKYSTFIQSRCIYRFCRDIRCQGCGTKYPLCMVTGSPITEKEVWQCQFCHHHSAASVALQRKTCALCHSPGWCSEKQPVKDTIWRTWLLLGNRQEKKSDTSAKNGFCHNTLILLFSRQNNYLYFVMCDWPFWQCSWTARIVLNLYILFIWSFCFCGLLSFWFLLHLKFWTD